MLKPVRTVKSESDHLALRIDLVAARGSYFMGKGPNRNLESQRYLI